MNRRKKGSKRTDERHLNRFGAHDGFDDDWFQVKRRHKDHEPVESEDQLGLGIWRMRLPSMDSRTRRKNRFDIEE